MPALGESVTEGTVTRWLKAEGDSVEVDEPLLEVSTDKVDTEIPSPVAGIVQKILVGEDETVPVGAELAVVGSGSGSEQHAGGAAGRAAPRPPRARSPRPSPSPSRARARARAAGPGRAGSSSGARSRRPSPRPSPAARSRAPAPSAPAPAADPLGGDAATYVTPLVRKLATEHGVDLSAVTGTGVGGRIRKQDVLDAAKAQQAAEDAAARPRPQLRRPRQHRPLRRPRRRPPGPGGRRQARHDREDDPAAQGHRPADGRVAAGLGAADHGRRGRRHQDLAAARPGQGRLPGPRGRQALVPAVLRPGRRRGAQDLPDGQREHRRRRRSPTTARRTSASPSTPSAACSCR